MKIKNSVLFICLFIAFSFSSFAVSIDLEADISVPLDLGIIEYTDTKNNTKDFASQGGILLGGIIGTDVMLTDNYGIGLDLGFYGTPVYIKPVIGITSKENHFTDITATFLNNYRFFYGSIIPGFVIRAINNDKLIFDITPGLEINYMAIWDNVLYEDVKNRNYFLTDYGFSVDLKVAFKLNKSCAFNVGLYNGISFLQLANGNVEHSDGDKIKLAPSFNTMFNYKINPRVGLLFFL